jgi:hypothetical protein
MSDILTKSQIEVLGRELTEINNELLNSFECDFDNCWIKTKAPSKSSASWHISTSIYGGVAGILLYFLESLKVFKSEKVMEILIKGCNWLEKEIVKNNQIGSFHTGNLGVIYVIMKTAIYVNDIDRLNRVIKILKNATRYQNNVDDLLNGTAGVILGLLKIHELIKEEFLLNEINFYSERLLSKAFITTEGPNWDRGDDKIKSLCGFSHGASGMAHLFFEIGRYFKNDAYLWLGKHAIRYENNQFVKKNNNWPDLRKGWKYDKEVRKRYAEKYEKHDVVFYTTAGDMSAWCHGSVGIGISRIRAMNILNDQSYISDINNSFTKLCQNRDYISSISLCHGLLGDIVLASNMYLELGDKKYLEIGRKLIDNLIEFKKKHNHFGDGLSSFGEENDDLSLFNGIAGVGYVLISLMYPDKELDIYLPMINTLHGKVQKKYKYINLNQSEMEHILLSNCYPRSLHEDSGELKTYLKATYLSSEPTSHKPEKPDLNSVDYLLESSMHQLEQSVKSWAHFGIFNYVERNKLKKHQRISEHDLMKGTYRLSQYCNLITFNQSGSDSQYFVIFIHHNTYRGAYVKLNQLQYSILNYFIGNNVAEIVLNEIIKEFEVKTDLISEVRTFFKYFIKDSLHNLILINKT